MLIGVFCHVCVKVTQQNLYRLEKEDKTYVLCAKCGTRREAIVSLDFPKDRE